MTTPSALTRLLQPVVTATINALAPFLAVLTDEVGTPYTHADGTPGLPIWSAYSPQPRAVPGVVVAYRPADTWMGTGESRVDFDATTGLYTCGIDPAPGTIRITAQATSEAGREYLADALFSAFFSAVFLDPGTGDATPNAVVDYLGSQGIVVNGIRALEYPPPGLHDPREHGLVYEVTLPVAVDVSLSWTIPGVGLAGLSILSQSTPDGVTVPFVYAPAVDPPIALPLP